jgi:hypothetical protein
MLLGVGLAALASAALLAFFQLRDSNEYKQINTRT